MVPTVNIGATCDVAQCDDSERLLRVGLDLEGEIPDAVEGKDYTCA